MALWCSSKAALPEAYASHGSFSGHKLQFSSTSLSIAAPIFVFVEVKSSIRHESVSTVQKKSQTGSRVPDRRWKGLASEAATFKSLPSVEERSQNGNGNGMVKSKQRSNIPYDKALRENPSPSSPPFEENLEEPRKVVESSRFHLTDKRFDEFQISPLSIKALHSVLKYEMMTVVQEATFPIILQGQDVMAKARTGTGKTIAFLLPAIELILKEPGARSRNKVYAMIVCPTRELAQQVAMEAQQLLTFHTSLCAQSVYGGTNIRREQGELFQKPCQILVGTPGRLVDHIQHTPDFQRLLRSVKLLVLDEADRMLDMGFRESLEQIRQALPSQRQNLLFSATIPKEVHNIARSALKPGYEFIDTVGEHSEDTHAKVKQQCILVPLDKQLGVLSAVLRKHIQEEPHYKVLVFCATARVTGFMSSLFERLGFNSREIHSRKSQNHRDRVSEEFRSSHGGIVLFTSDVSARGVDYPDVTLVVQVGAPSDAEQYIHRLGRTGRAGKDGEGLLVLAPWEAFFLKKLKNLPISELPAPAVSKQDEVLITSAASMVDLRLRSMAYQSWIGYYNSLKGLNLDKAMIVACGNQFSQSIGCRQPPAISKLVVKKMGLWGVQGLNVN